MNGNEGEVYYHAPRWLGSRSVLTGTVGTGGEGFDALLTVSHPFY